MPRQIQRRSTLALALGLALFTADAASAGAAGPTAHTKPWRCQIREGGTNPEWAACMAREVASQETRLNTAWKKLQPLLPDQTRTDLLAEQRLWVAFKDKSCGYWANGEWGREGEVLSYGACRSEIVGQRADYLEDLIEETGGH